MNFSAFADYNRDRTPHSQNSYRDAHRFDLGLLKNIPREMVSFGGMLLKDEVFRLPFPYCFFGGDHDFVENQFGYPNGMEDALENPSGAEFLWQFKRNEDLEPWFSFTKSFVIEAIDLADFPEVRDVAKQKCESDGVILKADFLLNVFVDYGHKRGWENIGIMVLDQGGDFYWHQSSHVFSKGETEKDVRLSYFFSYAMGFFALNALLGAVAALASKSTKQDIIVTSEKLNRARIKRGKLPIYEYRKIIIGHSADMPTTIAGKSIEGRASPRLHWRRGHYRTLPSNIKVPVAPSLVGMAENGIIDKDYVLGKMQSRAQL